MLERLRALLVSVAHLAEYTVRLVRAHPDSVTPIVLDILQQTEPPVRRPRVPGGGGAPVGGWTATGGR